MQIGPLTISEADLAAVCRRWGIVELSVFGSVLREDFGPESDVDVLVRFEPGVPWSLFDLVILRDELSALFNRPVDLLERPAVEVHPNGMKRDEILSSARAVYAA